MSQDSPTDTSVDTELVIAGRFRGPLRSGNGGYSCGALAALAPSDWVATTVRLSQPPPLDVAMTVTRSEELLVASYDGSEVARAQSADHDPEPVPAVDAATARAAEATYPGLTSHPFPTCFACGTGREPGDGLRIFPGPVATGGSLRPGRRTRASLPTGTSTPTPPGRSATPSRGRRSTVPAAGRPTSASGRWCSAP